MGIVAPDDILNETDSEFEILRDAFMKDKTSLHDQLFSKNAKNDTFLSIFESILDDMSDRTSVVTSSTFRNIQIEKTDADFGRAQIIFTADWTEYTISDSSSGSAAVNSGSSRYILNCVNENGTWKISEVHFEPII